MEGFGDDEIESILYIGREVSGEYTTHRLRETRVDRERCVWHVVFKIPPLKKNEGHRAQEWGDLGSPLWKGRMRIIERSNGVTIQFEDSTTGETPRVIA